MATAATSNRAYLWFLEFIKFIENENYLRVEEYKITKKVNYYILVFYDTSIKYRNYVKVKKMKIKSKKNLAIFETFKTKGNDLTGEAIRQRAIISILANNTSAADRTRTGISQVIAKKQGIAWKNIYSGIFHDLNEILLRMEIVEEDGRLPLKRGPKALQEKGIPYYHLTKKGILIAISISEIRDKDKLLKEFFLKSDSREKEYEQILSNLIKTSPNFTYSIFQKYVKAFCDNKISDLLPFDLTKLRDIADESLIIQKELLEAFLNLPKQEKDDAVKFLEKIT